MSLKDRLDEDPPEGWKPAPGDEVIGKIVNISMRTGGTYADYPIYTIRPEDGSAAVAVHAFHTALKNRLADEGASVGDDVAIRYVGFQETPDGEFEGYENYKAVVEHPPGWAPVEDPAGATDRQVQEAHEAATGPPVAAQGDDDIPF